MIKQREANSWKSVSYAKSITGAQTYTKFPIVLRTTQQSIPTWNVKANTETSGTPSPSSPIAINGVGERTKNLLNASIQNLTSGGLTTLLDFGEDVTFDELTIVSLFDNAQAAYTGSAYIDLQKDDGTHQYIALAGMLNSDTGESFSPNTNISGNFYKTYTQSITFRKLRIYRYSNAYCNFSSGTAQIAMYADTNSKYFEPYGKYKIPLSSNGTALTPIYLSQPLMSIYSVSDELNSNGTLTTRFFKLELDGSEDWVDAQSQQGDTYAYYLVVSTMANAGGGGYEDCLCTHYPVGAYYATSTIGIQHSYRTLYFRVSQSSLADWQAYLLAQKNAGTPVTVWCPLLVAITSEVTVPSITTTSGLNTIDVNTTVKPSEMSLTYNGWRINKQKKKSANLFIGQYSQFDNQGGTGSSYGYFKVNEDFVLSVKAKSNITVSSNIYLGINANGGTSTGGYSLLVAGGTSWTAGQISSEKSITNSYQYVYIYPNTAATLAYLMENFDIMLNTGSTALPYAPYWE